MTTQKSKTKSRGWLKWLGRLTGVGLAAAVSGASLFMIVFSVVYSQLPPIDSLTEYKPKVPLRVWSADGTLIGEYGEERRDFVRLDEIPGFVRNAVLAAEDNGFYEHSGIEFMGIARAALSNILTGRRGQGGSTITMQVARNFFLSSERTYTRKLYEVAMAYKIERYLTKDQILEAISTRFTSVSEPTALLRPLRCISAKNSMNSPSAKPLRSRAFRWHLRPTTPSSIPSARQCARTTC